MPKLPKGMQKDVEDAEESTGGFDPLPTGLYIGTLKSVEDRVSKGGNAMWGLAFEEIHDLEGNKQPGQQFTNLVLPGDDDDVPEDWTPSEGALKRAKGDRDVAWKNRNDFLRGKIKRFFKAFGYSNDSDTDEMIGERCAIKLKVVTIQQGTRKGEQGNEIDDFRDMSDVDFEESAEGGGENDDF